MPGQTRRQTSLLRTRLRLLALSLAAAFSCVASPVFIFASDPVEFSRADAAAAYAAAAVLVKNHTPRHAGTPGARHAAEWILRRAVASGLQARLDVFRAPAPGGEWDFANVVGEIPCADGPGAPWLVFLSHFDTYPNAGPGFEGANDGASTTGLLLSLAVTVRRAGPPRFNVAFIWTDGEEARYAYGPADGFQGSKRAAAEFKRLGRKVRAAVNLDMLGDRDLHIELPANATPSLNDLVMRAAARAGLADSVSIGRNAVYDDYSAFLSAGWPATDLIDFSFGPSNRWWHVPDDTLDKISPESLFTAGRISAAVFNLLDER